MRITCLLTGHRWLPDPESKETYPVILCHRCGKRRELSQRLVRATSGMSRRGRRG